MLTTINTAAQALVDDSMGNLNGWAICVWGQLNEAPDDISPKERQALPRVARDIIGFRTKNQFSILRSRRD